jgi:hypothetical protein
MAGRAGMPPAAVPHLPHDQVVHHFRGMKKAPIPVVP